MTTQEKLTVANTIWRQIGVPSLMRIGAHRPIATTSDEGWPALQIKVGGRQRFVEVALDPRDTYVVRYFRIKARTYERVALAHAEGVYADTLGVTIDRLYHDVPERCHECS